MPIREKGYYNWEGSLKQSGIRWLPIFTNGIKSIFRKKKSKLVFAFNTIPFLFCLLIVYLLSKPEMKMLQDVVKQIQSDAFFFKFFYTLPPLLFGIMILSFFAGAHLISADMKFKSFTLYLARPVSRLDYIQGKFSIIIFYLLLFTLVPGLLLIIFKVIFQGELTIPIRVISASIIFPIIISFFWASLVLMFSSLSTNPRLVIIFFVALYLVSNTIAAVFSHTLKSDYFQLFSIERNIEQFATFLFDTKPAFSAPGWLSGAVLIGMIMVSFVILNFRLKRAEV